MWEVSARSGWRSVEHAGVATPVKVEDARAIEAQAVATAVDEFKTRFWANVLSA